MKPRARFQALITTFSESFAQCCTEILEHLPVIAQAWHPLVSTTGVAILVSGSHPLSYRDMSTYEFVSES